MEKPSVPSARPGQDDAAALQEARELGLEGMLLNLASRIEVTPLGLPMRVQLKILRDCDGLVNKARRWLLEYAGRESLVARAAGGREEYLKEAGWLTPLCLPCREGVEQLASGFLSE